MVLADRANDAGESWPSIATLAKECGFSRSTVKNSLRSLRYEKGLISWSHRRDSSGDLTSSLYSLTLGGRAGAGQPRAGAGLGVGQEPPEGRAGAGHKASSKAPSESPNEAPLFVDDELPMAELIPSKKKIQELAESIYQEYPRKEARKPGITAIIKAMKSNDPEWLRERTKAYASAIGWKEKRYIPLPATWFNEERFNDDPENWLQPSGQQSKQTTTQVVNTGRRRSQPTNQEP
jgi:hypothetical protein